jgi:hypothetical protein
MRIRGIVRGASILACNNEGSGAVGLKMWVTVLFQALAFGVEMLVQDAGERIEQAEAHEVCSLFADRLKSWWVEEQIIEGRSRRRSRERNRERSRGRSRGMSRG